MMTEATWHTCAEPLTMLTFLRRKVNDRKLRLFGVACCRRLWDVIRSPRVRAAIEVVERFADGQVDEEAFRQAADTVTRRNLAVARSAVAANAMQMARRVAQDASTYRGNSASWQGLDHGPARAAEAAAQAILLRDIVGNPFSSVMIPPLVLIWNDGVVASLARAIDEEYAFDRLPILGDALEEAGCADAAVLAHARAPGPHVRGCWLIDVVLGKR